MSETTILLDVDGKALAHIPNKQLARAIDGCVKVARLYKKWGKPPTFHATKTVYNPPRQRARLAKQAPIPVQNICSRCGLFFIGSTAKRCQCKVRVKK